MKLHLALLTLLAALQQASMEENANATTQVNLTEQWLEECISSTSPPSDDDYDADAGVRIRITGGNLAEPNMFPHQVALLLLRPQRLIKCGGALISSSFILTAAHCLLGSLLARVYLGSNRYARSSVVYTVGRKDFHIYEEYSPASTVHDIALIDLGNSVTFDASIRPIALARSFMKSAVLQGESVTASGWGLTSDNAIATTQLLNYVDMTVLPHAVCFCRYRPGLVFEPNHICTDGVGGRGSCDGDSGGPLSFNYEGVDYLIGVSSFGSAAGCEIGQPSVFTRITSYLPWIANKTGLTVQ